MAFTAIPLDVPKNKGAVLIGGLASSMLSGFVYVQVVVYFKVYSSDMWQIKAVVASILFLDIVHSVFIWLVLWNYFITDFGLPDGVQDGHWEIGVIFIVTGILIFLAHLFHSHRLFRLAKNKYLLTVPIVVIASVRLVLSIVGGAQLLRFQTIFRWRTDVGWIFTTSLVLSAAVDVLLTISLISILCLKKRGTPSLNAIVDLLMRYAFETACVTCAGSLSSVFCWALMPRNLIFLGLYFVVAKLYSNSLLSTLNVRRYIRRSSVKVFPDTPVERMQFQPRRAAADASLPSADTQLNDEHSLNEIQHIARTSSGDALHVNDMSYIEAGRRHCSLSRYKPPYVRAPDRAHPRGKTVVEIKVERKVSDR